MDNIKYLKIEIITSIMNFQKVFDKFKIYFSNYSLNDLFQDKLNTMMDIYEMIQNSDVDEQKLKNILIKIKKMIWIMDDFLSKEIQKQSANKSKISQDREEGENDDR